MADYRTEHDLLGEMQVPADALWGVHTARALENFNISGRRVNPALIHAFGQVKLACARTNAELGFLPDDIAAALAQACQEMAAGSLDEHIVVDALQGGAGTSTNMNVNEVLAGRAARILGHNPGDGTVSASDHVNLHQSTNDTYPTALKVAAVTLLDRLERSLVGLLESFQDKEKQFAHVVKIGRTQMRDAVLVTLGREMAAYAEAFSRDRWRVYKCRERIRVVNLGGTAVGTGLGAPRKYIFRVIENLREITAMGLARAENMVEATQNTDAFVEVAGILKALSSNLIKICTDLRLLSSGPEGGIGEIILPAVQAGSSIMPGKVNPVIPEAATQAAMMAMACETALTNACSAGSLELNPFMPLVADCLLGSLDMLARACDMLRTRCVEGIKADEARCRANVENSTAAVTALIAVTGYEKAVEIARTASERNISIRQAAMESSLVSGEQFDELITPENVNKLGS